MNIHSILFKKINKVISKISYSKNNIFFLKRSKNRIFGDYQIYGIIDISKKLKIPIIILSKKIKSFLKKYKIFKKIKIIKPCFINIFINPSWISKKLEKNLISLRLGIKKKKKIKNIIVDYSSPNIAKEMHIGHLRSIILGDSLVRILKFFGHNVIKANHIGDWGNQFSILITYIIKYKKINYLKKNIKLSKLEIWYKNSKKKYKNNIKFHNESKKNLIKLQNKNIFYIKIWKKIINITLTQNQKIYSKLNVLLKIKDIMGESKYNDMLPFIVKDLIKKKIAVKKNGNIIVFLKKFKNKKNKSMGVIIQKKNKSYLYATIDIACLKYRYDFFKANRIIYYMDSRQNQYLKQIWLISQKAKYIPKSVLLEHHMFGMILKKNGKPFKTRSGNSVKLINVLKKAFLKTKSMLIKNKKKINKYRLNKLAKIISIGAIKYSDLSKNRIKNYIFNWDKMLNFKKNTSLYIQYAYTRIFSILKKNKENIINLNIKIKCKKKQEIELSLCILQLEEIISLSEKNGTPNILCNYLYKLSVLFTSFYEKCPILNSKNIFIKISRLKILLLTGQTIKKGLNLLGIKTINKL